MPSKPCGLFESIKKDFIGILHFFFCIVMAAMEKAKVARFNIAAFV